MEYNTAQEHIDILKCNIDNITIEQGEDLLLFIADAIYKKRLLRWELMKAGRNKDGI